MGLWVLLFAFVEDRIVKNQMDKQMEHAMQTWVCKYKKVGLEGCSAGKGPENGSWHQVWGSVVVSGQRLNSENGGYHWRVQS